MEKFNPTTPTAAANGLAEQDYRWAPRRE